ncbi:MAG: hypothetical protein E7182_05010 [Erysipelotrichaceae bacterium]|nr:hypothetical protein [Erysipelotrichaceae bacterium]
MKIAALPVQDRPREKLASLGPSALTDSELLALLFGTGTAGVSAVELAQNLLRKYGGFSHLFALDDNELRNNRGIGESKASVLLSLGEIVRRSKRGESLGLSACLEYLRQGIREVEETYVLCLNGRNKVTATRLLSKGESDRTSFSLLEAMRLIVSLGSKRVVLVHLHPSGIAFPSASDLAFTEELRFRLKEVGVALLDHVILSHEGTYSFLDNRT